MLHFSGTFQVTGKDKYFSFFSGKKYNLVHFERHLPFKIIFFFSEYLKKILGFTSKFR